MKAKVLKFIAPMFLFSFLNSNSQVTMQWSSRFGGSASDTDVVKALGYDAAGNVYITGFSTGNGTGKDFTTIKYNQAGQQTWIAFYNNNSSNAEDVTTGICVDGSGNVYVTGYSKGLNSFLDCVTIKYSPSGEALWTARYNGKGNDDDVSTSIMIDGLGNVYVAGYSVGSSTSEDFMIIKYNSAGSELWKAFYDFTGDIDIAYSMCFDNEGNIIVSGSSIGDGSQEDYATVKYSPAGDEIWSSRFNGAANGYDIAQSIAVDYSGNVYVTGYSLGTGTEEDYATLKYDQDGNELWVKLYNSPSNRYDIATSIAVDNSGNAYVTGYSFSDASSEDYYTLKYSSDGMQLWAMRYNGSDNGYDIASSLKLDEQNNVYVTGYSYEEGSEENIATIKYDSDGSLIWTGVYNGTNNGSDISTSLAVDPSGNIFVAGFSDAGAGDIDYVTIKYNQTVGINSLHNSMPSHCRLGQNYPNPFNPSTKIKFEILPGSRNYMSNAKIVVYNSLGIETAVLLNENLGAGSYEIEFNANDIPAGIYFYRLEYEAFTETKKMLLLK